MRRAPHRLLPVSLLALAVAGCTPSLQLTRDTHPAQLVDLRADYLAMNPTSPYREQVARGEIVRGMDPFGVLASWGIPEHRARDVDSAERWIYIDTDEDSGDSIEYTLSFRGGVLNGWQTMRRTGGGPALRSSETVATTPPQTETETGKRVPKE